MTNERADKTSSKVLEFRPRDATQKGALSTTVGSEDGPKETAGAEVVRPQFGGSPTAVKATEAIGAVPATDGDFPATDGTGAEKLRFFSHLIEAGKVSVILDARRQGVRVPAHLASSFQLVLDFSYRFHIDDFAFDGRGVRASLSFNGAPYPCEVPWEAVWMLRSNVNDDLAVYAPSVPPEIAANLASPQGDVAESGDCETPPAEPSTGPLKATERGADSATAKPPQPEDVAPRAAGLRLVDVSAPEEE